MPAQQQLQGGPGRAQDLAGEGGSSYQPAMGRIACGDALYTVDSFL
jgi:hypothetical protein